MNRLTYWLGRARLAALATLNPWRAVRLLREENERLVQTIAEPMITGINIGNGSMQIGAQADMQVKLLAGMFLGMFERYPDAKNYLEVRLDSDRGPILVTVVRPGGNTPHQLREAAEREARELRAGLEKVRELAKQDVAGAVAYEREVIARWYEEDGYLLDEDEVADRIRAGASS